MEIFLQWLLENSVKAGILALLVWPVGTIFSRRIPARWKYFLWVLVAVRLVMPNVFPAQFSLFNLGHSLSKPQLTMVMTTPPMIASAPAEVHSVAINQTEKTVIPVNAKNAISPWLIAFIVWSAGMAILGMLIMFRIYRLSAKVVKQRPLTDQKLLELLEDCKEKMNIHVPVSVVSSPVVKSPALLGFIRPRLLLPERMADEMSTGDLRNIFFRELTHLKRNDIAVNWVITAIQLLHWFNPVVWLAFAQMRAAREQACDETVLTLLGSEERKNYGHTIINLLQSSPRPSPLVGTAGIMEDKQQMAKRIKMISSFKIMPLRSRILAVVLIFTLGVFCLSEAKSQEKKQVKAKPTFWDQFNIWNTLRKGTGGVIPDDKQRAAEMLPGLLKDVYLVKFKPRNDFKPESPSDYLNGVNRYSVLRSAKESMGGASFFRTTNVENEYIGSFLTETPDLMKAELNKSPLLQFVSVEKMLPEKFAAYVDSPQEYWKRPLNKELQATHARLKSIIIKHLEFKDQSLSDAIQMLMEQTKEFDPQHMGVNFVIISDPEQLEKNHKITFSADNINVYDALIEILKKANSYCNITPEKIIIGYSMKAALVAAEQWMALIDAGKDVESWNESSWYFQKITPKEHWKSLLPQINMVFGKSLYRKITKIREQSYLPGSSAGRYVVIEFDSSFEKKTIASEFIIMVLSYGAKWRVHSYHVK